MRFYWISLMHLPIFTFQNISANFAAKNSFAKYGLTMSLLFGLVAITSNQYTNVFFDGILHRRVK